MGKRLMINGKFIKNKSSKKYSHLIASVETVKEFYEQKEEPNNDEKQDHQDRVYPILEKPKKKFIPKVIKYDITMQFKATGLPKMDGKFRKSEYVILYLFLCKNNL